jgi:hypothetical protein
MWDQCGGLGGNCAQRGCVDGPFAGASCPSGAFCQKFSQWYYQCLPAASGPGGQCEAVRRRPPAPSARACACLCARARAPCACARPGCCSSAR